MCIEFIQALLLLLFTCYHPFCQEHPKGFMLWPFAYCSFSHEWWSINKHQGVWKCARRGKRISTHTKSFNSSVLKFIHLQIIFVLCQSLTRLTISIFIPTSHFLSLSTKTSLIFLIYNQLVWLRTYYIILLHCISQSIKYCCYTTQII